MFKDNKLNGGLLLMSLVEFCRRMSNNSKPFLLSHIDSIRIYTVYSFRRLTKYILDTLLDLQINANPFLHISPAIKCM